MLNVAITGGSGFMAGHLIKYLQEHSAHLIREIRTIDRRPYHAILEYSESIPLVHHCFELTDASQLQAALHNVQVVFHLARKRFEFNFCVDQKSVDKLYVKDNLNVTKCLMEAIVAAEVPNLVYVGDAYANLSPADNFGTSEAMHGGAPSSYLLGEYGAARTSAELHARSFDGHVLRSGNVLHCVFLRPTFVYGEGDRRLAEAFHALAAYNNHCVPHFQGPSNGMHQYIYAGTLAKLAEASMRCLLSDAQRCAGEFFYCMDETHCTKFAQFFTPVIQALGYSAASTADESKSEYNGTYYAVYAKMVAFEFFTRQLWRLGWYTSPSDNKKIVSSFTLRFFYGLAFGFSDRKLRLILARSSGEEICSAENKAQVAGHLAKTAKWLLAAQRETNLSLCSRNNNTGAIEKNNNNNKNNNEEENNNNENMLSEEESDVIKRIASVGQVKNDSKTTFELNMDKKFSKTVPTNRILRMG